MCGRFSLTTTNDEMRKRFGVVLTQNLRPRWNIAPTHETLILKSDGLSVLPSMASFGFVPRQHTKMIINARSETISEKPSFSSHLESRRCLVIASGWYEWTTDKKPYHVQLADGRVMAMAGLYRPAQRNQPEQFVVVTTAADGNLAEIHHRSPAVLPKTAWSGWLSAPVHEALKLLSPPPAPYFNFYPVSSAVGRVSNDYPELVAPLTTSEGEADKHGQAGQADLFR